MLRRLLTAITIGALGAAAGAWLGWCSAGDLPTDQQARAIVAAAVPDAQAEFVDRFDVRFGHHDGIYTGGFVTVTINYPETGESDLAVRAHDGFDRMGWATADTDWGGGFEAEGDGLRLLVYGAAWCGPGQQRSCGFRLSSGPYPALAFRFQRDAPWPAMPLTVAGWLAGLVAGWSLGGRARFRWLCWAGLVLMLPGTIAVTAAAASPGGEPDWAGLTYGAFGILTLMGGLLLVVALLAGRGRGDAPAAEGSAGASRSSAG
jgi:hypothetical protein